MHRYQCWNGAMPTTAPMASVATGISTKTMLQLATPATRQMQLISWGFVLNGPPNGSVELIQTDVAATVTAHAAAGVQPRDPNAPASLLTLGVAATGYTASIEGAITATRLFSYKTLTSVNDVRIEYEYQWMPDERPIVAVSKFLRVRATMGSSVNMTCWVIWDE